MKKNITNDSALESKRKFMVRVPLIIVFGLVPLFWVLGGGRGRPTDLSADSSSRNTGFNANLPTAENKAIEDRNVDASEFGRAQSGQVLSVFANTRKDSVGNQFKAMPAVATTGPTEQHAPSLATTNRAEPTTSIRHRERSANPYATTGRAAKNPYYYIPPGSKPGYYAGAESDQQVAAQLRDYQAGRNAGVRTTAAPTSAPALAPVPAGDVAPASVQLTDNATASRLSEEVDNSSPFYTAPTEGSRRKSERAILSGGNSYGNKKTIAWMIPIVVHEDQTIKDGQQVKLRLLKEVSADGVTIPANTILYAVCKLSDDRLRLTVNNLQLHGQLIPLNLDVYDTDGSQGVNVPGLTQSSQNNGQLRSSAIQGLNLPGIGGLASTVLSSARMSAANSARQTTIRLRAGYNLFLKA